MVLIMNLNGKNYTNDFCNSIIKSLDKAVSLLQEYFITIYNNEIFHNMPKLENRIYSKKPPGEWGFSSSTRARTRTGTALLPTDFKSVA